MAKAVGIDLGTTFSEVAVLEGGEPVVITSSEGSRLVPSYVAVNKNGERLVGQIAKRQAVLNSENTVFSTKRFIGRKFNEVAEEIKIVPYKVTKGKDDAVRFDVGGKQYAPEEISAQVLRKLVDDASKYLAPAPASMPAACSRNPRTFPARSSKPAQPLAPPVPVWPRSATPSRAALSGRMKLMSTDRNPASEFLSAIAV